MDYDLNLLRSFDVLYREQSVSRAAARRGLSQPAMSAVLARLRDLFQDQLFTRARYGIQPTEKSHRLQPIIEAALAELDQLVQGEQTFDPATAEITVEIAANDYFEFLLLPRLVEHLSRCAPGVRVEIATLTHDVREAGVMSGHSQLAFGRLSDPPDNLVVQEVFREGFGCLARADHPRLTGSLSRADFEREGHCVVRPTNRLRTGVFTVLDELGLERRTHCVVTHFQAVPAVLEHSELIATLPRRICQQLARSSRIQHLETPGDFGSFPFHLAWHRRFRDDPAHRWLREQVRASWAGWGSNEQEG